jgi:hypothetical protein
VARRDWLFGGGGDSFSENDNAIFRSHFSPLRSCGFYFSLIFICDFLLLPTSVPGQSADLVSASQRFIRHAKNGRNGVSKRFHE